MRLHACLTCPEYRMQPYRSNQFLHPHIIPLLPDTDAGMISELAHK